MGSFGNFNAWRCGLLRALFEAPSSRKGRLESAANRGKDLTQRRQARRFFWWTPVRLGAVKSADWHREASIWDGRVVGGISCGGGNMPEYIPNTKQSEGGYREEATKPRSHQGRGEKTWRGEGVALGDWAGGMPCLVAWARIASNNVYGVPRIQLVWCPPNSEFQLVWCPPN